jgi:hypothetical protein
MIPAVDCARLLVCTMSGQSSDLSAFREAESRLLPCTKTTMLCQFVYNLTQYYECLYTTSNVRCVVHVHKSVEISLSHQPRSMTFFLSTIFHQDIIGFYSLSTVTTMNHMLHDQHEFYSPGKWSS